MGLATEDFASLLTDETEESEEELNPFLAGFLVNWHHAVARLRKWLGSELEHHDEHEDGLTR